MRNHLYVDVPGLRRAAERCPLVLPGEVTVVDLGRLADLVSALVPAVSRVVLCGGTPALGDTLLSRAGQDAGFVLRIVDLSAGPDGVEALAREVLSDSRGHLEPGLDAVTLVCGDDRLVPTIESLRTLGLPAHAFFFVEASRRLKRAATTFWGLDGWFPWLLPWDAPGALPAPPRGDQGSQE